MSGGSYGHDTSIAVDSNPPRGSKRMFGDPEELERKRINTSRRDTDPGPRESQSPGGNGGDGASGVTGGNGGNGASIRGRAVSDH